MEHPKETPKYIEGVGWRYETKHRQTRRHRSHDYGGIGTYEICLVVEDRTPVFGHLDGLKGEALKSGRVDLEGKTSSTGVVASGKEGEASPNNRKATDSEGAPVFEASPSETVVPLAQRAWIVLSPLGEQILRAEIPKIHQIYPQANVWQVAVMPDHLHLIIRISASLPEGKSLGSIIRGFKTGCSRAQWKLQSPGTPEKVLFESGYNDHILMRDGQLDNWKRYLAENPVRAWVRKQSPELMQRSICMIIGGVRFGGFGNFYLLRHPEKHQVFFHRKTDGVPTEETEYWTQEHERLKNLGCHGDVLVTPGISECEKRIKNEAIQEKYRLIHIQKEPIGTLWKPERSRFLACTEGTLLILAPWTKDMKGQGDSQRFHQLNEIASMICNI